MGKFEEEYKLLNDEQRQAVDNITGPLLVIAGPGTGKTQLLSMRVAAILKNTDTDAGNILCLTFTNKAAANMRERLLRLAGQTANGVYVKTFHSFAAEIMNNYPDYFWNGARLMTAPDAVQLEIVQTILNKLPLDNPLALQFAGQYTMVSDVKQGLKLTKEAGLTPEKLRAIISHNLAYIDVIEPLLVATLSPTLSFKKLPDLASAIKKLTDQQLDKTLTPLLSLSTVIKESLEYAMQADAETGKTTNVGKWKAKWVQTVDGQKGMFSERRRNQWWLALADVYQSYRETLHGRGYYDYADMLVEVITQLEQRADLRAEVQERFLYVLIDEFQDTNAAQLRLAHLVSDHFANAGKPNLMAVGDDDQSIYKFNGAELNNMLSFRRSYPSSKLVILEKNYRSSQNILDTSARIIEQAADRLVKREPSITKKLQAMNEPKTRGIVTHYVYPTKEHQLSQVARTIAARFNTGQESIAVLARGHHSLKQMASILQALDVPVSYEYSQNVLEYDAVKQANLIAVAAAALQTGDVASLNAALAQSLAHPMWQLEPKLLWHLAVDNYHQPNWLNTLQSAQDAKLPAIASWLMWLAAQAAYQPLPVVLEYILGLRDGNDFTSPVKKYFIEPSPILSQTYIEALSGIRLLSSLVSEFAVDSQPTLTDWVWFVRLSQESSTVITDETPFVSAERAVGLYTVHKAKGLEFDSVYIIDAVDDNWKPRASGRKPPANLPLQPVGDDLDDYVRLLYVAATRARLNLLVSSYTHGDSGQELISSPLIINAFDQQVASPLDNQGIITLLEENLRWPRLEQFEEQAILEPRLENYRLSATDLIHFLDISRGGPVYFLERNLLRLPGVKSATQAHGIAIHAALELAQKSVNSGNFTLKKVLDEYRRTLSLQHLPREEYDRYLPHGCLVLQNLFKKYHLDLSQGSLPEQALKDIMIGEARVRGQLDRLDMLDTKTLVITDYKTGKPLPSFTAKNQSLAVKAWRQRLQLTFYSLLLARSPRFKQYSRISGQIIYVEAESARDLSRSFTPSLEELARLEKLILVIWSHIMNLNFPDVSHYSADFTGITQFEDDLLASRL